MADLERSKKIAEEVLANIAKETEAKKAATAEPKDAAADKAKADAEKAKVEGLNSAEKAEAQAKEDERILSVKDEELSEEDKKRKAQLGEIKKKKEESPEEKIKRVQESSQKRIDEIKSELLEKDNKSREQIARLEAELAEVKKSIKPKEEDAQVVIKRQLDERISKFVEEDKSKPREERREMSKEELDEWYLEDPVEATAWINERTMRRVDEKRSIAETLNANKGKQSAEEFVAKQQASFAKLVAKYPRVKLSESRLKEVDSMMVGKSYAEQRAILEKEEPYYLAALDLTNADPKKYMESADGPEQAIIELDKKFGSGKAKIVTLTEEELEARIKAAAVAEAERIANLEDEGLHSTQAKNVIQEKKRTEFEQKQYELAKKAGLTQEQLEKSLKRRESIPGASLGRD